MIVENMSGRSTLNDLKFERKTRGPIESPPKLTHFNSRERLLSKIRRMLSRLGLSRGPSSPTSFPNTKEVRLLTGLFQITTNVGNRLRCGMGL